MELILRLLYTTVGTASILYFIVKFSLSYWRKRGILHEEPKFLWGNLKGVGSKYHIGDALQEVYKKYKGKAPFIGFYAYLSPVILVLDLDVVQHILTDDAEYFTDRGLYYNAADDPLSQNLFQIDGVEWHQMRNHCEKTFSIRHKIEQMFPTLMRVADTFQNSLLTLKQLQQQEVFVINSLVDSYNVDVISALGFGLEGDSLRFADTEFGSMTRSYNKNFSLFKSYLAINYPMIARLLQYKSYDQLTTQYFLKLVNEKIKEREWMQNRVHQNPNDLLSLFTDLNSKRDANLRMDNKQIAAQAFSFILTSLEALNATLTFCIYELALRPELQDKARAEIANVLQQHQGELCVASLQQMVFLKQILYETLRKHSPHTFLLRRTTKDYEVPNSVFMLQKDNRIVIPISAIHNDPKIYPNPERFDPDRFDIAAKNNCHSMSWLAFGAGVRNCIAQELAEWQMLVGLVTLLKKFKFSPCAETIIPPEYDNSKLLHMPKTEIKLRMERVE